MLHVDPAALFIGVPFSSLPTAASLASDINSGCLPGMTTERCFSNDATVFDESSNTLFTNLTGYGPYRFAWAASAP